MSAPTIDCPQARTKVQLRDCYFGKISWSGRQNAYRDTGDDFHYTEEKNRYQLLERDILEMPGKIDYQKKLNEEAAQAVEKKYQDAQDEAATEAARTIPNCNTYQIANFETTRDLSKIDGDDACSAWRDADGDCTLGNAVKKDQGTYTFKCKKT